jgi:molybdate transport system substrate-binding protein
MQRLLPGKARRVASLLTLSAMTALPHGVAFAADIEVFHADSLAGPMRELKAAYEVTHPGVTLRLNSGVSRQLAERILRGDVCDVFAPSSPAVIDEDLMNKPIGGSGAPAATWYVVFSANEMVIVTAKGNPLGIRKAGDLARPGVRFVRVTGERDLATGRTVEFLERAAAQEGDPGLARRIVDSAPALPGSAVSVPDTVNAVRQGRADAGVVYYSAAVAARGDLDIVRFPDSVNLSETIRNAATVPGSARNPAEATGFASFLVSAEARDILKSSGQPPVIPPILRGAVPAAVR